MTIRVNVVCFDLPAAQAAKVAEQAGGELVDGQAGPVVIRVAVPGARKAQPAARKATRAVQEALEDLLGPGPHSALPIVEDGEGGRDA